LAVVAREKEGLVGTGRSKTLYLVAGTALAFAAGGVTLAATAGPAGAATSAGITVKVTGAFNGTLHAPPNDCQTTTAKGGQISFTGKLKGSKADEWTLTFLAPHAGKWPGHTSGDKIGSSSFVLQSNDGRSWVATKGSFVTNGTSGSANITMGPEDISEVRAKGNFHIAANWNCAAPPTTTTTAAATSTSTSST
jgi:hypothetical protein